MEHPDIAFIGGGNMAAALLGGLLADGRPAASLCVSDPDAERLRHLAEYGVRVTPDNQLAVQGAGIVVFAVKPQILQAVATRLAAPVQQGRPLVISVAAGVRSHKLDTWLGGNTALVRCMPNTPALVRSGATGLYANSRVSVAQYAQAEALLHPVPVFPPQPASLP